VFEISAALSNPESEWRNKKVLGVTELEQIVCREIWQSSEVCWGYDISVEDVLQSRRCTKKWCARSENRNSKVQGVEFPRKGPRI